MINSKEIGNRNNYNNIEYIYIYLYFIQGISYFLFPSITFCFLCKRNILTNFALWEYQDIMKQ
jgi:hypothetical protein